METYTCRHLHLNPSVRTELVLFPNWEPNRDYFLMHFPSRPDSRVGDAVLINSSGRHDLPSLICIDLKLRRDQRNWIQRSHGPPSPSSASHFSNRLRGVPTPDSQLGSRVWTPCFFNHHPCEIASHQEGREKKNLFKYNSCLEMKISILCVSFVKLKSIGCHLKRCFFGAPTLILCLTDVSINTWWSVTSQPTSEQRVSPGTL